MYLSIAWRGAEMDQYSPVQLTQPLQQPKKKPSVKSILKTLEHTQLTPIREEPKRPASDPSLLQAEAQNLSRLAAMELQRNEAFEALDAALTSAAAKQKLQDEAIREQTIQKNHLEHRSQDLEARNRALEERCIKLSAWAEQHRMATSKLQAQLQAHSDRPPEALAALANLDAKHSDLDAKHAGLSAKHADLNAKHADLGAKHADLSAKHTDLTIAHSALDSDLKKSLAALANLDAKHAALEKAHTPLTAAHAALNSALQKSLTALANLDAKHSALEKAHASLATNNATLVKNECLAKTSTTDLELQLSKAQSLLRSAEARADVAERSVQSLLWAKKLAASAPVARELLEKATLVLGSSADVLRHVHCRDESSPQLKSGLNQVCDALSALEADLRGHSADVGAWLAKRAAVA